MIKKIIGLLLLAGWAQAFTPISYVQISTNTLSRQAGTVVIGGVNVSTITASTATVTTISVTTITPTGIVGTTTNNNANTGNYGEYISSQTTSHTVGTNGTYVTITTVTLTAGDWDISATVNINSNGATWTLMEMGIGTADGNSAAGLTGGVNDCQQQWASSATTPLLVFCSIPSYRVSIAATTTYYQKLDLNYSLNGPPTFSSLGARMTARRVR